MDFVINEWFLDWHRPDALAVEKKEVYVFFQRFLRSNHKIVVLQNSPFLQKLHRYRSTFDYDIPCRLALKNFFSAVLQNPEKCVVLQGATALPSVLESKLLTGNYASDQYLFQAAQATDDKIIVTTDRRLVEHIGPNEGFNFYDVETFKQAFL
ncbi:MAG: hypothetical protein ACOYNO_13030 [Saprospiraceae bacterium]|jgi:hypothetical protein